MRQRIQNITIQIGRNNENLIIGEHFKDTYMRLIMKAQTLHWLSL